MVLRVTKDRKNIGFLELSKLENGDLEIAYIWIAPNHRGEGYASKLLRRAIKVANSQQKRLVAYVEPHKDSSLNKEKEIEWLTRYGFLLKSKYRFGTQILKPVMVYCQRG